VTDEAGKVYTSTVTYQVCPTTELVAILCDEESGEPIQSREYKGLNLSSLEFLTDGEDCLSLLLYYRRTDWLPGDNRSVRFGSIAKVDLTGSSFKEYRIGTEDEPFGQMEGADGLWYTSISSARPLLATARRQSAGLSLHVEGRLAGQPAYYRRKTADLDLSTRNDTLDQPVKPLFLHLKLWVIPGWKRGTSIAGATVVVPQANGEQVTLTREYELELCTQSDGPTLSVESINSLRGADRRGQSASVTLPDWLKAWRLQYSGLQWDTIKQAKFSVFCRFKDAQDAVSFNIDVEENGSAMFAALISDANQIDLTNPEWDKWENLWSFSLLNKIILPEFRGPIYNMRRTVYMLIYGSGNMPKQFENYSCGDYSLRIRSYLQKRRHGNPETALKMNGLECAPYVITGAHDFAGIYLSSMHPKDNPIFIDPWYEQHWTEKATGSNYGYKFQAVKFTAACSGAIAELFLLGRFIWQCIRMVRGSAAAPTLTEVMAALKNVVVGLKLKVVAILSEISGGGLSWSMMGPNSNVAEHDDDFNYVYHKELDLFEHYGRELEDQQSLPPVKAVDWPQAQ
jgi:hypothetical protein